MTGMPLHIGWSDVALRLAVLPDQYIFELRGAWSRRTEISQLADPV